MLAARPGKSNPPREEAGAVERAAAGSSPGASAIWVRTRRAAGPDGGTRGLPAAVRPAAAPLPSARPQVPGPRSPTAKKPERRTQFCNPVSAANISAQAAPSFISLWMLSESSSGSHSSRTYQEIKPKKCLIPQTKN